MAKLNLGPIGINGLNEDTPSFSLDPSHFNGGINMRPFDGSLQGVYSFGAADSNLIPSTGNTSNNIYGLTQWTRSGSNELNLAYVHGNNPSALEVTVVEDITGVGNIMSGSTTTFSLDFNTRFDIDVFSFNDVLIINDGMSTPKFIRYSDSPGTSIAIPSPATITGWFPDVSGTPVTARRLVAFNNRLVAINLSGSYQDDNDFGEVSLAWSTPIANLDTLSGMTWQFAATNSAGDDIATETPGRFLDGGTQGNYLIAYKEDGVLQYSDTGSPLYLVGELLPYDDGIYSPGCFVHLPDGRHLVMGNHGVYWHEGGARQHNVSRDRVEQTLYDSIDPAHRDRTFMFRDTMAKEAWICYRSRGSNGDTNSGCDMAYVYNYHLDTWYRRTLENLRGVTETNLNGRTYIYGWGDNGIRLLNDFFNSPNGLEPNGHVTFEYVDLKEPQITKTVTALYPMTEGRINLSLNSVANLGTAVEFPIADRRVFDPSTSYKKDYRITGRYFNLELRIVETSDSSGLYVNPQIAGLDVEILGRGRR